ncbi:MAG: MG2 domain-containing protein, partial [archaeon]
MEKEKKSRKEKISKLKEKIERCNVYKIRIKTHLEDLEASFGHGDMSLEDYNKNKKQYLQARTEREWQRYYDDIIKDSAEEIDRLEKGHTPQRKRLAVEAMILLALILTIFAAFPAFNMMPTGHVVLEEAGTIVVEPEEKIEVDEVNLKEEEIQENFDQINVLTAYSVDAETIKSLKEPLKRKASARSTALWKCDDWNPEQGRCDAAWEKVMDLSSGKEYQIEPDEKTVYMETGVASINTRKSLYHPGETAEMIMVVLDRQGHLVDNAYVNLTVTDPNGATIFFSTQEGTIRQTSEGIYEAEYDATALEGNYTLFVQAKGSNVDSAMLSYFTVKEFYEFDILRDTPVTIDPWLGAFNSSVNLVSFVNVSTFDYTEVLPGNFAVTDTGGAVEIDQE